MNVIQEKNVDTKLAFICLLFKIKKIKTFKKKGFTKFEFESYLNVYQFFV